MADRRTSRDDAPRNSLLRNESSGSQSSNQPAVPSIETSESEPQPRPTLTPLGDSSSQTTTVFRMPGQPRSGNNGRPVAGAKVAIPRLKRTSDAPVEGSARSGGRHRVNHACEPCRHRKTKCSGERPICRHCQDFNITCYYADGKRDRAKKQFGSLTEKVADYEKLLRELMSRVGESEAKLIGAALEKETAVDLDEVGSETATTTLLDGEPDETESGGESEASAGAGSTGALDRTDEDFTRDQAQNTGFMGKNSEVTWLQRLREENRQGNRSRAQDADLGYSAADTNYHLDDLSILTLDAVDPYELPPIDIAQRLFQAYITRVHPSFPIVGKVNLSAQFQKFITGQVNGPPKKWLAIINLIFAIGAKYAHLIDADWKGDERDHLIYFTRARLLAVTAESMFQHPDLQSIQILALLSFYFLCIGQVNRSWTLNGVAIRGATALALNMRNDSVNLKDSLKEIRYRLWWALYTLEHRLCGMTGRVNCILDDHCTTPLPAPVEEDLFDSDAGLALLSKERQQGDRAPMSNPHTPSQTNSTPSTDRSRSQTKAAEVSRSPSSNVRVELEWAKDVQPNSSLYFLHLVQLSRLTQSIFHRLYCPSSIEGTWSDVQTKMKELDEQLENWFRRLPTVFDFTRKQRDRDFYGYRLNLGFFFYGTKMMIFRPCLCRLDRKIPNQSGKSLAFNRNAAVSCVEAAQHMLSLIPDEPNAVGLIRVGPWWSILHWIVQSATVLMLEITFRAHHMPEEADRVLEGSKKALRWLHALGEEDMSAARAWLLCNNMLREAVLKIGRDVSDLPNVLPGKINISAVQSDTEMSGIPQSAEIPPGGNQFSSMYGDAQSMPSLADFDPMMQYDQYFPGNAMGEQIQFPHPTDAEIEFMSNAYHDGQGHQGEQGEGGESRFG